MAKYNGVPSLDDEEWPMNKSDQWSTGLFHCFDDCRLCCMTCWCPCITFGRIAEIIDSGSTSFGVSCATYGLMKVFTGWQCIYSSMYRNKMRDLYGMPELPCLDLLVHCCCERCALCQMYRELSNRGYDMNIGYHENVRRMEGGKEMMGKPPLVPGGMYR